MIQNSSAEVMTKAGRNHKRDGWACELAVLVPFGDSARRLLGQLVWWRVPEVVFPSMVWFTSSKGGVIPFFFQACWPLKFFCSPRWHIRGEVEWSLLRHAEGTGENEPQPSHIPAAPATHRASTCTEKQPRGTWVLRSVWFSSAPR